MDSPLHKLNSTVQVFVSTVTLNFAMRKQVELKPRLLSSLIQHGEVSRWTLQCGINAWLEKLDPVFFLDQWSG